MNWPLMCPPDLPGSAVGLRVLTTDLTFRRKPLPGFKWPLILIDWFMCFGALVCILYIFNRVQSCSIHIQFVHNDTRFSEPAASKIYRSQENSLKKQPLANTGHCEFSCVRVIPQSEPTSSNWPQKGQYFHLSPRPSQGQHEIKNHPFYRTHPCFTQQIHIVCWQFFEVELWLFSPFWFTLHHDID